MRFILFQSEEGDKMSELMQRVCETLYCLRTFEMVFPSSDIQHWLTFSHTDMLEECLEHLNQVRAKREPHTSQQCHGIEAKGRSYRLSTSQNCRKDFCICKIN